MVQTDWREKMGDFLENAANGFSGTDPLPVTPELDGIRNVTSISWAGKEKISPTLINKLLSHLCICSSVQLRCFEFSQIELRGQIIFRWASHLCGQPVPTAHSSRNSSKSHNPNTVVYSRTLTCRSLMSRRPTSITWSNLSSRDRKWTPPWCGQRKGLALTDREGTSKSIRLLLQNNVSWLAYAQ